ncbi:MAG: DUF3127 domain-containing protein [Candidatus Aphodosoma sp.]
MSELKAQGRVIFIAPAASGVSKSTGRDWMSQEYVIEIPGQYPRKICFRLFGQDRINEAHIQMGEEIEVYFDIDAREYNGRWFNSINAYRISRTTSDGATPMEQPAPYAPQYGQPYAQPAPMQAPATQAEPFNGTPASSPADDLPF